jgi:hypothetical protein
LLVQASILVGMMRIGLWILPFNLLRRLALRISTTFERGDTVEDIVWAVRAASRHIPHATCLTQALAAHSLLSNAGHRSRVHIGVGKDEHDCFNAHAWVVVGGSVVVGGPDASGYTLLLAWEGNSVLRPTLIGPISSGASESGKEI